MAKTVSICFTILVLAAIGVIFASVDNVGAKVEAGLSMVWLFVVALATILIVALALGAIVVIYALWTKYVLASRRPVDGAFPLQSYRVRKWRDDLPEWKALLFWLVGERLIVNVNEMIGPAALLGAHGYRELEPAAGWGAQTQVRLAVERTNGVRAMFPGDAVRSTQYGAMSQVPRTNAGTWKVLDARREAVPEPVKEDAPQLPVRSVAFGEAVRSNTPDAFALGCAPNGEIVRWDVTQAPHVRVHGKSQGSGKTNLIKTIAVGAILQDAHVIVLDRRSFKDWSDYRGHVEMIDNRKPGALLGTMQQIQALYMARDRQLGESGAANIRALAGSERRVFVVISEFGSACRAAADSGELDEALPVMKSILSEAGATGVHLVFEDQVVTRAWPRELRGNADPITGYLPEDAAAAGGYSKAHQLQPYEFHYDGTRLRTWSMEVEAPRLLARAPRASAPLIDCRSFGVRSVENNDVSAQKTPEIIFSPNERTPNGGATDLQKLVWQWRDANPDGTQAELRREFAEREIEIARGYAHQCWHAWPGAAQTEPPQTAAEALAAMGLHISDVEVVGRKIR